MNKNPYKIYYQIIFILIFILLFLFGYKLSPYIFSKNQPKNDYLFNTPDDKFCLQHNASCQQIISFYDQHSNKNQNLNITLNLPNPILVGKKFIAKISVKNNTKIDNVKLNFEGVKMNMGENSFVLQKISDGEFQGEIIIPICISGKMLWRVSAELTLDNGKKGLINWLFES